MARAFETITPGAYSTPRLAVPHHNVSMSTTITGKDQIFRQSCDHRKTVIYHAQKAAAAAVPLRWAPRRPVANFQISKVRARLKSAQLRVISPKLREADTEIPCAVWP
jgi:hypothetical protein